MIPQHKISKTTLFLILLFFITNNVQGATSTAATVNHPLEKKDIILIHNPEVDKQEKEALIILPGFGGKRKTRKCQKAFFGKLSYDLYIPDYHHRKSYQLTIENFENFYQEQALSQYKKVHVFAYIMGSWVMNEFINKNGRKNIHTIVYDRSPLQERAPKIVVDKIPFLAKMTKGQLLFDFEETPYPVMNNDSIRIGIIVENKATKLIKFFKKQALSYGKVSWNNAGEQQVHHDLIHVRLDHDEMYQRFDIVGVDIVHFLKKGQFTEAARRVPFEEDAFE